MLTYLLLKYNLGVLSMSVLQLGDKLILSVWKELLIFPHPPVAMIMTMTAHDAMEIYQHAALTFSAPADAEADGEPLHMLMIEMAFTGKGRTDL
jgi:hypothetical protein